MKRMLLFAMGLLMGASVMNAQVYEETDLTSQFQNLTLNTTWGGSYTATNFCPMVEVGGGIGMKQVVEKYAGSCSATGTIMNATVSGLTAGTYKIELYGGAAYTYGRGFNSDLFSSTSNPETEAAWAAGDAYTPEMAAEYGDGEIYPTTTGAELYAVSEGVEYGGQIPVYYATDFPDGAATVTLEGIVVGSSGSIEIGIRKTAGNTNWHVVQLKSVIATVNLADLLANVVARANEVDATTISESLYAELQNTVSTYNQEWTTAEEYNTAIDAIQAVLDKVTVAQVASPILAAMKELVDATNVYTQDAYQEYYGQWADKYDEGTLTMAEANALQNPSVATGWHASITCDDFLLSAWDAEAGAWSGYYINTWSTEGDSDGSNFRVPFFEYWTGDGNSLGERTLTATMTGLAEGNYKATAWVRVRIKNGASDPTGITFQVNDGIETNVCNGSQVGTSQFYIIDAAAIGAVDESGVLNIKFNVAADNNISWLSFKNVNFELTEEDPLDLFKAQVTELKAQIANLETTIPTAAFTSLKGQADEYADEYTTQEDYEDAIAGLQSILDEGKAMQPLYVEASLAEVAANELTEVPYSYTTEEDPATTMTAAIEAAGVEKATNQETLEASIQAIKNATYQFVADATPTEDNVFDLTDIFLVNADLEGLPTWNKADGWYTEQADGNSQVMVNDAATSEDGTKTAFYEYWSWSAKANDKFNLYTQTTLPAGTYTMNCYAFAKQQDGETGKDPIVGVYFYANDTQGSAVSDDRLTEKEVSFVNATEGNVKIGLKAVSTGNTYNWMGIGYVKLYKVADKSYSIDENAQNEIAEGAGDVELKRTIKEGANTVVLPFSMTQEEVEEYFGEGSVVYVPTTYTAADDNINFNTSATGIPANVPVLLKATVAGTEYTIPARTIVAGDPVYAFTNGQFIGSYYNGFEIPTEGLNYVISSNKLYVVNSEVTMKATRAYLALEVEVEKAAKVINITFDGEATGIATVEDGNVKLYTGKIFDISGREVKTMTKGIYVVDGKKVMVK